MARIAAIVGAIHQMVRVRYGHIECRALVGALRESFWIEASFGGPRVAAIHTGRNQMFSSSNTTGRFGRLVLFAPIYCSLLCLPAILLSPVETDMARGRELDCSVANNSGSDDYIRPAGVMKIESTTAVMTATTNVAIVGTATTPAHTPTPTATPAIPGQPKPWSEPIVGAVDSVKGLIEAGGGLIAAFAALLVAVGGIVESAKRKSKAGATADAPAPLLARVPSVR